MKPSELLQYAVVLVIVGLIGLLLLSQLLGQPFIVFVETGSMAPTLEPNDGYIAVPALFAGEPQEGDIILFMSQELGGGELTTHRVEAVTDEGYITKGDANPFTDQDGDEPVVSDGQIRSVALTMGSDPVRIPGLGAFVVGINDGIRSVSTAVFSAFGMDAPEITTISTGILAGGLVLYIFSVATGTTGKRSRSRSKGSILQNAVVIIAILTLVVIIPLNFSMLLPSGVYQYEIISSTSPTDNEQIIEAGGSSEVTYAMRNSGHLPVLVFLEPAGEGVEVQDTQTYVPRRSTVETSVTMHAPEETGSYLRFVREHRYLVVLPPSLIAALHEIHPVAAFAGINLVVTAFVIIVSVGTIGTDRVRLRSRRRELSIGEEIKRALPTVPGGSGRNTGVRPGSDPTYSWFGLFDDEESTEAKPGPNRTASSEQRTGPDVTGSEFDPSDDMTPAEVRSAVGGETAGSNWETSDSSQETIDSSQETIDSGPAGGSNQPASSGFEFGQLQEETEASGMGGLEEFDQLSDRQLIELHTTLQEPPEAAGRDADRWTPAAVQAHLMDSYGIEYSQEECARLMERSGIDR